MDRESFRQRLAEGPLLLDGAMGTLLHGRGIAIDECFDALNISQPAIVAEIHRDYIAAGADILETNSFGANHYKLAEHGLEDQVRAINTAAVEVARRVIASSYRPVLLAGSVGPLGVRLAPLGRVSQPDAIAAFAEQIAALVAPDGDVTGVDLLVIETISDLSEVEAAVRAARQVAPDVPLVAQISFTRDDVTVLGETAAEAAQKLAELEVDVAGANCSSGPAQVLRLVNEMHGVAPDLRLSAAPNAGWPEQTEGGRVLYPATPAYFASYATAFHELGVALVGGCCGTHAAHIAAMREALDHPELHPARTAAPAARRRSSGMVLPAEEPTKLAQYLQDGRFIATVEMRPPKGIATQRMLAGAHMLKEAGANFLDVADSPLARMRMSAWAAAQLIQRAVGLETILHFPTRGRNLLRIQGDLLAAYAMDVRNLFVVMGDPTHIGDYPEAMDNYDIVPTGLIQLIKQRLNAGVEQSGASIDRPTSFVVGAALNLEAQDPARQITLLRKKLRNGADFLLTQPVFNPTEARAFIERCRAELGEEMAPVIAGIQPLYNSNNAEFLHNEVPGITISTAHRERMRGAADPQAEGVRIAQEIVEEMRPHVQGVYLIPQFGRYDLAAEVLDVVRSEA
ncbi:MAG: bifunctional homocysteine S-methyltransferase/methylenetetrahydrofolate reductase [Anaerolineae bacterium]|nr:bifunctional homocysteine S-methyltransferase/methylenetetrahydrofolate reductase [Anaerolineae bacterium]